MHEEIALPKNFWEQLPLRSDEELYEVLANQADYLPEAVAAAEGELAKRNLPQDRVAQLKAAAQSQKMAVEAKATEPLSWPMRILIGLFCMGLSGIVLAIYFETRGYKRKAQDCLITLGVTLVAYVVLGGLIVLAAAMAEKVRKGTL